MLELDYGKKLSMLISNDAFSFLYFEEEPLDDENQKEIDDIIAAYPNGYFIEDYDYELHKVRVEIIPYVESAFSAQFIVEMINSWTIEYKIVGEKVEYRFNHYKKGPSEVKTVPIERSQFGRSCDAFILAKNREDEKGFTRIPFQCKGTRRVG